MSKQIQRDEEIYITPSLIGIYENGRPTVIDKQEGGQLDPKDINDKIIIYDREVKEWFLNPALELIKKDFFNNGFIVLMICMSYFEGVEQYKTGVKSNNQSKLFFKNSVNRLYPNKFKDKELEQLYSKSRCGLFHNGMVGGGVVFSINFLEAIEFQDNGKTIKVNPKNLLQDIYQNFEEYIDELKSANNNEIVKQNFGRVFSILDEEEFLQ